MTDRVYFDKEEDAHSAAREQSKTVACGLYVDSNHKGFYVTPLGRLGSTCYLMGKHESEIFDEEDR